MLFLFPFIAHLVVSTSGLKADYNHGFKGITTDRPLVIAHRGASGVYPEHTVEAYREAISQGADFIECDVVVTKDLHLVCVHDNWLSEVTNVLDLFPGCVRTMYVPDKGYDVTDCFVHDFTLEEIKTLGVRQRYSSRDQSYNDQLKVATLSEFLEVAAEENTRTVGIYPELKNPEFVNALDIWNKSNSRSYEDLFVSSLHDVGYASPTDPCIVQCFSQPSLIYMRNLTQLPCVILRTGVLPITDAELDEYQEAGFQGFGPSKTLLLDSNGTINDVIERVHQRGLAVHPWTFRNDILDLEYQLDVYNEYEKFSAAHIDGAFIDFPDTYRRALELLYPSDNTEPCPSSGVENLKSLGTFVILFSVATWVQLKHMF